MTNTDEGADVVDVLTTDHREVRQLLGEIRSTDDTERGGARPPACETAGEPGHVPASVDRERRTSLTGHDRVP